MRSLVLYAILLAAFGACRRGHSRSPAAVAPPPSSPPATEQACRSCRGIWAVHGLDQQPTCNCRTTDAGKRCRDGADCQGRCLAAEVPDTEVVEAGPPARGYFLGRCSELAIVLDCHRFIERGAAARGPVPLGAPPPVVCQD